MVDGTTAYTPDDVAEGRGAWFAATAGMGEKPDGFLTDEPCFLCSSPIWPEESSTIYAGVPAHTECYWRDIGVPKAIRKDPAGRWYQKRTDDGRD